MSLLPGSVRVMTDARAREYGEILVTRDARARSTYEALGGVNTEILADDTVP